MKNGFLKDDFENILFSEERIKERISELGKILTRDYEGKSPILVGVLKGSFIFLADLSRAIELNCEIRFISASSYGQSSVSSGAVKTVKPDFEVKDRHVILIEDILDSGVTLKAMQETFLKMAPASLKICALLDKTARRTVRIAAHYTGFECPDEFVVGYGLDFAERYRNLPFIASLKPEIYS